MDNRDAAAAQDRAARMAALSNRIAGFDLGETDEAADAESAAPPTERRITGHYRGQPVYDDATVDAATDAATTPAERRITGYYRGQPVYED